MFSYEGAQTSDADGNAIWENVLLRNRVFGRMNQLTASELSVSWISECMCTLVFMSLT